MGNLEIDTICADCKHEFPHGGVTLYEMGWGCPKCASFNMRPIIKNTEFPCDPEKVNVRYEEGEGH